MYSWSRLGSLFLSQLAGRNPIPERMEVSVKLILSFGPALVILSLQGVARAQTFHVPAVEVGGQAGLIGAIAEGVFSRPIAGPRLTVNISQQNALEFAADTLVPNDGPGIY